MKTLLILIVISFSTALWSGTDQKNEIKTFTIDVQFPTGSSTLGKESHPHLEKLADFMEENPKSKVEIQGYTDNVGNKASNQKLSEARAKSIQDYLIKEEGIEANRITAHGYGSENALEDNATAEGRALNRRVIGVVSM